MANANGELGELEAFDEAVRHVSGGRLRIKWHNEYGRGRGGNAEVNLIRDVSAGKADLGWAGTRVFDELGSHGVQPAARTAAHRLLRARGEGAQRRRRRPDAREPGRPRAPEASASCPARCAVRSASIHCVVPATGPAHRISESGGAQIEAALRSLGARVSYDSPTMREPTVKLDGIETHIAAVPGNHYHYDFPYLTGQRRAVAAPARALRGTGRERG